MSTSNKLWLGFGTLTLLLLLFGIAILIRLLSIGANIKIMATSARPRSVATRELENGVLLYAYAVRNFRQFGDVVSRNEAATTSRELKKQLAEYERLAKTARQRAFAARFAIDLEKLQQTAQDLMAARQSSLSPEEHNRFVALRAKLLLFLEQEIQKDALDQLERRQAMSIGDVQVSARFILVLTILGTLVAVGTTILTTKSIVAIERAHLESTQRFRAFMENSPIIAWIKDDAGRYLFINNSYEHRFGVSLDAWRGKTDAELFPPDIAQTFRDDDLAVLADGKPREYIEQIPGPDGNTSVWWNFKFLIHDAGGKKCVAGAGNDITDRRRAEEALVQSKSMLQTVLDTIPQGVFWKDRQGSFLGCNRVVSQFLGFSHPREVIGLTDHDLPGTTRAQIGDSGQKDRQLMEANVAELGIVKQVRLPTGDSIWLETSKVPIHDGMGQVIGILGTCQDITERKCQSETLAASLKEKESLLKEIHHRVKNNLQIITSLLNLQGRKITDPRACAAFNETRDRVRSMALLHETLYRTGNLAQLDLREYVASLGAHLFRSYGVNPERIHLHMHVADLALNMDQAIPCGLILNELLSNSIKHAFPAERIGELEVALRTTSDGICTLTVQDNGIGFTPPLESGSSPSLGMQVVQDLTHQLQGTLAITHQGGTACTVKFHI